MNFKIALEMFVDGFIGFRLNYTINAWKLLMFPSSKDHKVSCLNKAFFHYLTTQSGYLDHDYDFTTPWYGFYYYLKETKDIGTIGAYTQDKDYYSHYYFYNW